MVLQTFIAFEGLDGAGTSTQIKLLAEKLTQEQAFITEEPTNNEIGRFLRKMLNSEVEVDPKTACYLFAADRCEHVFGKGGILEQHNKGKIVITDRYLFSSLAYQSIQCGKNLPFLLNQNFPLPKILFFFELEPEKSLERVLKRAKQTGLQTEIYEKLEIQKKTYCAYQDVIAHYEKTEHACQIIHIDASQTIEAIHKKIWCTIEKLPKIKCETT